MKPKVDANTRQRLIALNRRFYAVVADAFDQTRRDPWPGWERSIAHLDASREPPLSVLDVGCGNGRFASFLSAKIGDGFHYVGIDSSPALLEHARNSHPQLGSARFLEGDILDADGELLLADVDFDLIAIFGLLHHIPGRETRQALIARLTQRLAAGGLLIATAWQFATDARFRERIVPWAQYNETAEEPVDPDQLEAGDHLLRFADAPLPRYCHFTPPEALRALLSGPDLEWLDDYAADGRSGNLNRYAVVRRTA
ncbi:MAG: class I SAM-dependent methyltransferase [bacterium]|nr:class I SAM-dependent methyltransferase [bacterium]